MKKLINDVENAMSESLAGFCAAHSDIVRMGEQAPYVQRRHLKPGKVALISGGGSGHEPLHTGFVGFGMLDAACPGQVFTSPTPDLILAAAEAALLDWARACGELAGAAAGRQPELAALRAAHSAGPRAAGAGPAASGPAAGGPAHWLERRISEIPALVASLSIPAPAGLASDLAEVAGIVRPGQPQVFSPGDICPDNNLLTAGGVRFIDFESAEFHSVFLDAAYLRMPFSTCWCVFRLPERAGRAAEAAYRDLVGRVFPDLGSDGRWQPGVRRAMAAWTLHAMTYLLDRSMAADKSMIDDGRAAPTARQLLRYRWRRLLAELEPAGELESLCALARDLLTATESWSVPELPLYPAFR